MHIPYTFASSEQYDFGRQRSAARNRFVQQTDEGTAESLRRMAAEYLFQEFRFRRGAGFGLLSLRRVGVGCDGKKKKVAAL